MIKEKKRAKGESKVKIQKKEKKIEIKRVKKDKKIKIQIKMMSNIIKKLEIIGVKLQMIRIISVRSCCAIVRAYVRPSSQYLFSPQEGRVIRFHYCFYDYFFVFLSC